MSGYEQVRSWKDLDERGDAAHPSGEINLAGLSGGAATANMTLAPICQTWDGCRSLDLPCPVTFTPRCPPRPLP
jgi:hypothetical protein